MRPERHSWWKTPQPLLYGRTPLRFLCSLIGGALAAYAALLGLYACFGGGA